MADHKDDKKCCSIEAAGEGTSLLTRFLRMLDPSQAPVDPRSTQDVLVFAKHYAELVRYYDLDDPIDWVDFENGEIVGPCNEIKSNIEKEQSSQQAQQTKNLPANKKNIITWKEFFYSDIAVVAASIARWQRTLSEIKKEYDRIRRQTSSKPSKENFRKLFLSILHHLERIDRWYHRSTDHHPLKQELEEKIKSFLVPALKQLISYDKGMVLNVSDDLDLVTHYDLFKNTPWNVSFNDIKPDDSIYVGNSLKQKIIYALMYVDDVFNTLFKVYEEVTGRSDYYWKQAIESFPTHQPHMALFISFVELFSYARNELNDLTRRQLEFFYRDVLHLKEKPARPDSVYLIYQLAKGVDEFDLKKGTQISAGKDALGKPLVYQTDKELVINKASVKELKTIFLDKASPIKNIYAAPVANSADGKGEKFKDPEIAWPTFGYFEPREKGDKLTGEEAKFGLAIASPQFQLSSGERTVLIRLKFKAGQVKFRSKLNRIDNQSFKIYFSGEKEWIQPENQEETPLNDQTKLIGIAYPTEEQKILDFIRSATDPVAIAGKEPQEGPVLDNPAKDTSATTPFEDYDFGTEVAKRLIDKKAELKTLSDLLKIDGVGEDKVSDLIYTFSDQYVAWKPEESALYLKVTIHTKEKAIVPFNKEKLKEDYTTTYPLCKIEFSGTPQIYELFKAATIESADIFVKVKGLTDLVIETDDGPVDPKKPVFLFTARPQIGSAFSIGSAEFINKKITRLSLKGEWVGELDFKERYSLYANKQRTSPASYTCTEAVFYENGWHVTDETRVHLFQQKGKIADNSFLIQVPKAPNKSLALGEASETSNSQLVKFILNSDFGHDEYPVVTVHQLANRLNMKGEPVVSDSTETPGVVTKAKANDELKKVFIPKPPITPQVKSLSIDYTSLQTLHNPNGQLFHIYPFGFAEIYPYKLVSNDGKQLTPSFDKLLKAENKTDQLIIPTSALLPQFKFGVDEKTTNEIKALNKLVSAKHDDFKKKNYFHLNQYTSITEQQGNLYIGISDLVPPQNLSLLFKFADGTAYDNDSTPPKINWSYLVNNEWFHLPPDHIITDGTYGFQTTGIILFDFPADATNNNTILTTGLYWLCASIEKYADRVPKLIDVIAQANQASFFDQQNDPVHYNNPLPEKTISKPIIKIPEVKSILQPFESFDGKHTEQPKEFYQRVSERLRHKGRAIAPSDYEHLVLEEFPSVYKVKVLSHTDPECLCRYEDVKTSKHKDDCCCPQIAPGHVLVIAISNLRNKNAIDPLKPRTGRRTLIKIEEFLKKRVSPFVHVHVKNPKFEEVKVAFNVKFYTGVDKGFYLKKLNDDIVHYLTPWAYDSNIEVSFGNKIYGSKIIDFIEGLDYVDYITCFRMIHIAAGCCEEDSLPDLDCSDMHADLVHDPTKKELAERFINEISARSSQAILVSAKQHCIELIEDEPEADDCNCGSSKHTK